MPTVDLFTRIGSKSLPERLLEQLKGARLAIIEANGAIIADALRTSPIASRRVYASNYLKWRDWVDSVSVQLAWRKLGIA